MEISGISHSTISSINNTATKTGDAVSISVLKKAMDIQAQSAASLLQALPDPDSRVGQNVNVTA